MFDQAFVSNFMQQDYHLVRAAVNEIYPGCQVEGVFPWSFNSGDAGGGKYSVPPRQNNTVYFGWVKSSANGTYYAFTNGISFEYNGFSFDSTPQIFETLDQMGDGSQGSVDKPVQCYGFKVSIQARPTNPSPADVVSSISVDRGFVLAANPNYLLPAETGGVATKNFNAAVNKFVFACGLKLGAGSGIPDTISYVVQLSVGLPDVTITVPYVENSFHIASQILSNAQWAAVGLVRTYANNASGSVLLATQSASSQVPFPQPVSVYNSGAGTLATDVAPNCIVAIDNAKTVSVQQSILPLGATTLAAGFDIGTTWMAGASATDLDAWSGSPENIVNTSVDAGLVNANWFILGDFNIQYTGLPLFNLVSDLVTPLNIGFFASPTTN